MKNPELAKRLEPYVMGMIPGGVPQAQPAPQAVDVGAATQKVQQSLPVFKGKGFTRPQVEAGIRADYGADADKIIQGINWSDFDKPQEEFPYAPTGGVGFTMPKRNEGYGPVVGM
jgi:hypothetical protein